jgi:hypothetical protein
MEARGHGRPDGHVVDGDKEVTWSNPRVVRWPALMHILEHPERPVTGLGVEKRRTDCVSSWDVLGRVAEKGHMTQSDALEDPRNTPLKISGTCARFEFASRAAKQTGPIHRGPVQGHALRLQKMNDPVGDGANSMWGERHDEKGSVALVER